MKCTTLACNHFSCGSIGHHRDCELYPDSMQEMIDTKNEKIKRLTKAIERLADVCCAVDGWESFPQKEIDLALDAIDD